MAKPVLTSLDFQGTSQIKNLADGTDPQDAATVAQLQSIAAGLAWKSSARVATQSNISLATPGATIDGITMATNDRVLLRAQSDAAENGIYIWNGASTLLTRATDANTFRKLEAATITVEEGTSAGVSYRQQEVNGTLETDDVTWTVMGTSAAAASETTAGIAELATQAEVNAGVATDKIVVPATLAGYTGLVRKYSATIGDNSSTSIAVTHNLGTRAVTVEVYQASGSYDEVEAEIEHTDTNTVTLKFAAAPTTNSLVVVVVG